MELLVESRCVAQDRISTEIAEMDEILRMVVSSIKTLSSPLPRSKIINRQSKMD
jgi:hypothetical protein